MEYNRIAIKQEVRRIMKVAQPRPIWVSLLCMIIISVGTTLIQLVIGGVMGANVLTSAIEALSTDLMTGGDPEQILTEFARLLVINGELLPAVISGSLLSSVLVFLWGNVMNAGFVGYSLNMVRGKKAEVVNIFSAFPRFGKVVGTRILATVFSCLWGVLAAVITIIALIPAILLAESASVVSIVLIVLIYLFALAAALWIQYRFAMVDYLVMDHGIAGLEALTVSKQMMKGNKWKLFVLQLSFMGWYLLALAAVVVCSVVFALLMMLAMTSVGGLIFGVILAIVVFFAAAAAFLLFNSWITAYLYGAHVKFYEYAMSCRPDLFVRRPDAGDSFGDPSHPSLD